MTEISSAHHTREAVADTERLNFKVECMDSARSAFFDSLKAFRAEQSPATRAAMGETGQTATYCYAEIVGVVLGSDDTILGKRKTLNTLLKHEEKQRVELINELLGIPICAEARLPETEDITSDTDEEEIEVCTTEQLLLKQEFVAALTNYVNGVNSDVSALVGLIDHRKNAIESTLAEFVVPEPESPMSEAKDTAMQVLFLSSELTKILGNSAVKVASRFTPGIFKR